MAARPSWTFLLLLLAPFDGAWADPGPVRRVDYHVDGGDPGIRLSVREVLPVEGTPVDEDRVVVFVHGFGMPSRPGFDVPAGDASWAEWLARRGYAVHLFDLRDCGRSTREAPMDEPPERNPPVARSYLALRDLAAVVDHVRARRGVARVSLVGWSWGGTLAGWYASLWPERVRALVLYAPLYEGRGKPEPLGTPRAWLTLPAGPAAILGERYARVYPLPAGEPPRDAALLEALSRELLASDPTSTSRDPPSYRVPAGAGVDLHLIRNGQLLFHASSIQAPTLVVLGAADTVAGPSNAEALLRDLASAPVARALILPGLTHIAQFDPRREQLFTAVERFLREPARVVRAGDPPALAGRWVLQDGTGHLLELRAGGTGTFRGEPLTWTVDGSRLTMVDASGSDTTGWRIEGDRLVLSGPFETEIVLAREPRGAPPPVSR